MKYELPDYDDFLSGRVKTLGWGVLDWCSTYLAHPTGEIRPWVFYNEQALFVLRFYAVDEKGEFLYYRAILERPKKWGKSPLLAALCCAELLGPVRFSHWDANGNPVGKPVTMPLVQIAAISVDQVDNTYKCLNPMLMNGYAAVAYGLTDQHVMLGKVQLDNGGEIQKATASWRGRQGQRITFAVCDETHLWVPAEKGPELFEAINNNAVGMNTRVIETTNAPVPGEGSVAEASHNAVNSMIKRGDEKVRILLDTRNVDVDDITDKEACFEAFRYVYGDSTVEAGGHVVLDRIWAHFLDPSPTEESKRRFYLNQRLSGKAAWISVANWETGHNERLKLRKDDPISIGFKATKYSTGLVACRLTDRALFVLGHWEHTNEPKWEVPFSKIDKQVRKIFEERDTYVSFFEPERWAPQIAEWHSDYEEIEEFWWSNKQKTVRATEQFEAAVDEGLLSHYDERLDRHVYNAQVQFWPMGNTIRKEHPDSTRHIALAQAAILAFTAGTVAIEEGALNAVDNTLYRF